MNVCMCYTPARASGDRSGRFKRAIPHALGLSQAEVGERMGVTKSRVSQIERGERRLSGRSR